MDVQEHLGRRQDNFFVVEDVIRKQRLDMADRPGKMAVLVCVCVAAGSGPK